MRNRRPVGRQRALGQVNKVSRTNELAFYGGPKRERLMPMSCHECVRASKDSREFPAQQSPRGYAPHQNLELVAWPESAVSEFQQTKRSFQIPRTDTPSTGSVGEKCQSRESPPRVKITL